VLLQDLALMAMRLESLKRIGVRIAIDDFGTGYSALSYLHQLPVDLVKIDRSFVDGLVGADPRKRALVEGVVALIHGLGLKSVAEGIENSEQLQRLSALACEHGQGYLFAPPLPAEQVPAWMARSMADTLLAASV
jgi:EAL domain-containing protein (putative c-di-GMP-specific phosphodiesterase class I)